MDEKLQDNNVTTKETPPTPQPQTSPAKQFLDPLPPPQQRFDESTVILRTIKIDHGEKIGLENFQAWQQRAFWLLYMKKEMNLTLTQIAKMVGKSRETVCRFGRSMDYRRIAGDTSNLDLERMTPLALKRLEIILKFSANEKVVAENAKWIIERGLEQRTMREKLDALEKQPRDLTQFNIGTLNLSDLNSKTLAGMRMEKIKKLEALLGPAEQEKGDPADPSRHTVL